MADRTYTLFLTADDLKNVDALRGRGLGPAVVDKLYKIAAQAQANDALMRCNVCGSVDLYPPDELP